MPPTGSGDTRVRDEVRAVIGQEQSRIDRARSHGGRIPTPGVRPVCYPAAALIAPSISGNAKTNPDSSSRAGSTR